TVLLLQLVPSLAEARRGRVGCHVADEQGGPDAVAVGHDVESLVGEETVALPLAGALLPESLQEGDEDRSLHRAINPLVQDLHHTFAPPPPRESAPPIANLSALLRHAPAEEFLPGFVAPGEVVTNVLQEVLLVEEEAQMNPLSDRFREFILLRL